ncbi:MAG TPA: ATP-binding protein [Acidimicrobiales bacterium]
MRESIRLPAAPSSPRRARLFVDEVLHRWRRDGAIERTALIASELVTNAVRHARTDVVVHLEGRDDAVYLEVHDRGRGKPRFLDQSPDTPGGLGLPIVEALASSWGVSRDGAAGKAVWAEVRG